MQLTTSLLLPALIGAAQAVSDVANVYLVSTGSQPEHSWTTPTLSSREARLVLAERLGVSQYHDIHEASEQALTWISAYGRGQQSLFGDDTGIAEKQLVVVAEGWTNAIGKQVLEDFKHTTLQYHIRNPSSEKHNEQLVQDLDFQQGALGSTKGCVANDLKQQLDDTSLCWAGSEKIVHLDLTKIEYIELQSALTTYLSRSQRELVLVAMPESSRNARAHLYPYGPYEMPPTHNERRYMVEDPLVEFSDTKATLKQASSAQYSPSASNNTILERRPAICHASFDSCVTNTNNCSGHGTPFKKYSSGDSDCFACRCEPVFHIDDNGKTNTIYYGGAACQKLDVSSQFWLIASFTVVLVGLVSWAIGMMFSIGEEKLPGVIGAGVSGPKAGSR